MQPEVREFYQLEKLWSTREASAEPLPKGVAN
jgi:ribosomal silencing factor RsfS